MLRRLRNWLTSSTDSESTGKQPNSTDTVIASPVVKPRSDNAVTTFVPSCDPTSEQAIDERIAALAINKMGEKGWFDICTYKECRQLIRAHIPKATMDRLHVLHCVHFSAMPPDVLSFVEAACHELFHARSIDLTGQA